MFLPFFIIISLFATLKLAFFGIRLSDTNVYFYEAYQLLSGKLLYKDIFFTNLPLWAYVSSFYYLIVGKRLDFFYLSSTLEILVITILLLIIVYQKYKDTVISLISIVLYLFSFIVLTTSDHQTGVFLATLLSLTAYLTNMKNKPLLTGIFLGLAIATKAYTAPIAGAFLLYYVIDKRSQVIRLITGMIVSLSVIVLPPLIHDPSSMIHDLFSYSLTRPQGLDKLNILRFFLIHDILLVLGTVSIIVKWKRQILLFLIILLTSVFFIIYQDTYYLYLNILVPFMVIGIAESLHNRSGFRAEHGMATTTVQICIYTVIAGFCLWNTYLYITDYSMVQKLPQLEEFVAKIKKEKPDFLYGPSDIAPALAYLSSTPLLDNVADTNETMFRKKVLDAESMTNKALKYKTILITHAVLYPSNNIDIPFADGIYNKTKIAERCQKIADLPVKSENIINRIYLLRCY